MFDRDKYNSFLKTKNFGRNLTIFDSLQSTNNYALEHNCPVFSVITASRQTAGRGRSGRNWVCLEGENLYFTLILPKIEADRILPFNILAGFAMCDVLRNYFKCYLKWPNDIVYAGKKIAGILIDTRFNGNKLAKIVLGLGVNINAAGVYRIIPTASSIKDETGKDSDPEKIMAFFMNTFEDYFSKFMNDEINIEKLWYDYSAHLNLPVDIHINNKKTKVIEKGIDANGALIVAEKSGKLTKIYSGDIGYDFCR